MTTPAPDYSGLIERLEAVKVPDGRFPDHRGGHYCSTTDPLCAEAAAAIRDLEAERERLREATGAKAVVRGGLIVISIEIDALPLIMSGSIAAGTILRNPYLVTDPPTFAKEVCAVLNNESEDGTTRVHLMFDAAIEYAIEYGAEGVESCTEAAFEQEASRLQEQARVALTTTGGDRHE